MFTDIIPYSNIIVGVLIFIVGFVFHWIFQLISALNWNLATKIGVQEKKMLPEYKVYEHAIAAADSMLGWIYGFAAVGLIFNISWAYKLAWIPAVILVYHGLSCWFWMGNQKKSGHQLTTITFRFLWFLLNFGTGIFCIIVIW